METMVIALLYYLDYLFDGHKLNILKLLGLVCQSICQGSPVFRTLYFSASKTSDKPPGEVFSRIDSIHKLISHEGEFERFEIEDGDENNGTAIVVIRIFGKVIRGKMRYSIRENRVYAAVESPDIRSLEFGYIVESIEMGSKVTQFVRFDMGSIIANIYVSLFLSKRIKRHLREEVSRLIE